MTFYGTGMALSFWLALCGLLAGVLGINPLLGLIVGVILALPVVPVFYLGGALFGEWATQAPSPLPMPDILRRCFLSICVVTRQFICGLYGVRDADGQ